MRIIPFEPWHIEVMELQPRQAGIVSYATLPYVKAIQAAGPSASAEHAGRIVACGGVLLMGFGIGSLWVCCAKSIVRHAVSLDRALQRLIELEPLRRLEATTEADWPESCRWLEHLGFAQEGLMRKYGPNGEDHYRYARVM